MKRYRVLLTATLAGTACFQDFSTDPPVAVRAIEHVSPPAVQVLAGDEVPAPTVRVIEQASRDPVVNETVEFLLRPQSGSVLNVVARTDANGIATAGKWTVPVQAGEAILDVRSAGVGVSFVATIKPGAPVGIKALDSTIAWAAGELAPPPIVAVVDRFGNPVDGAGLSFSVTRGGGELMRTEVISSGGGKASPGWWRLGTAGENEIRVSNAGTGAITIRTLALEPATITWYALQSAGGAPIPSNAVETGKLGLTKFDPCFCRGESGYFILDAVQAAGFAGPSAYRIGMSGRFQIQSGQIRLIGEAGETRFAPEGSLVSYMVRDQGSVVEAGTIRLDVARFFQASGNWFTTSWVFKEPGN